jgi:(+)-neomenthol dehydrogenase
MVTPAQCSTSLCRGGSARASWNQPYYVVYVPINGIKISLQYFKNKDVTKSVIM